MIKINNISMAFRSELTREWKQVLNNISFNVESGDCLGILGESGSGKSTLCRIITGLLKPTEGEYLIDDINPYHDKTSKKYLSEQISIVFQDYNTSVNPRFTVYEIIAESLLILKKRQDKAVEINFEQDIDRYLKAVGLDETFKKRFPHQLSGGQLQRVCIARALAIKPRIILFDEAISSLDAHTQVQLMDLLKELREEYNLTYIFITHDLTSVTYLCNKVMFLYEGSMTEFIDVQDISKSQDAYAQQLLNTIIML